jgi:hypothetical protein
MFTIKDLSEGKCAVINDGTLEELKEVLKLAFPNDISKGGGDGSCQWYTASTMFKGQWSGLLFLKDEPTQSVKLFLTKSYPKVMWVSLDGSFKSKYKRVVFMEKNGHFFAWDSAETIEGAECATSVATWSYAKDIDKEYTMQEIADALNIDVNDLKIKK